MRTPVVEEESGETLESPRERLVCGMNEAVAAKGYAATTIADVVRAARVSKRTFYEQFDDKLACFLAAYDAASAHVIGAQAAAAERSAGRPWEERVEAVVVAYLDAMAARPELTRTFLVEILGAGPQALVHRREAIDRFADELVAFAAELRRDEPRLRPISRTLATAVVGGVNELVLSAAEHGRAGQLAELREPAVTLIRSVLRGGANETTTHGGAR
jgi:AcrR family transcriptional regulator